MANLRFNTLLILLALLFSCNVMEAENGICDTVKARQLVLDFYRSEFKFGYDSVHSQVAEDSVLAYLTPSMYDKLGRMNNTCGCNSIIRAQDYTGYELHSLSCRHLDGNWYMVSFKTSGDAAPQRIPVRVSASANGQLKINYIVPDFGGEQYGDNMLNLPDVKIKDNKTALAFVTTFFSKYAQIYATIPETLHEDLHSLRAKYCSAKMLAKFDNERKTREYDGLTGYDSIIEGFDFDALWYPQLKFLPVNPSEVLIKFNGRMLRANVARKDGHLQLDDITEVGE